MIRAYFRNQRGAAAVEFAMMLGAFTVALPSAIDLGVYAYDSMQVRHSAQMGLQAVWAACSSLPVTSQCATAGSNAVTTGAQQTSLGANVTVSSSIERYSCTNSSGALYTIATGTFASPLGTNSSLCASSDRTTVPGDYLTTTVTYTYSPVFANISVASLLGTSITSTATMRLL
jgi:Flp pilus assembly protein TadG